MSQQFLGEIRMVGFNFPPRGWAFCNGQLLAIAQNQALFSLLGTTYGGDGQVTFALPNLQSRHAVHTGTGGPYTLGQQGGQEAVTLTQAQLPGHVHQPNARTGGASDASDPSNATWGLSTTALYGATVPAEPMTGVRAGIMAADALNVTGGSQPHPNQPPFLGVYHVIALQGIFPSRN